MPTIPQFNASQQSVLAALTHAGSLTRRDVCARTRRSWAAISKAASRLHELGLIVELETNDSAKSGRRPGVMRLNPDAYLVGTAITPQSIDLIVAGLDGVIHHLETIPLPRGHDPVPTMMPALRGLLAQWCPVLGIGISFPGLISPDKRRIIHSVHFPDYDDRPLAAEVQIAAATDIPVLVERNAVCAMNALRMRRRLHGDTLLVSLVSGVSAAVYIDGQILHGRSGNVGELGHLPAAASRGIPCACGSTGCIETEIGGLAWKRQWHEACPDTAAGLSFRDAIRQGSPEALRILSDSLPALFPMLAQLVILLRPDRLAIIAHLPPNAHTLFQEHLPLLFRVHGATCPDNLTFLPDEEGHIALGAAALGLLRLGGDQPAT